MLFILILGNRNVSQYSLYLRSKQSAVNANSSCKMLETPQIMKKELVLIIRAFRSGILNVYRAVVFLCND